jgi:hypothetical protein
MFVIAEAIIERRSGAFEPAGPSTALAFNMHASVVMPLLESPVTLIEAFDGHRWDSPPKIKFAPDSPLEGGGFEPSVPQQIRSLFETARPVSHHGLISRPGTDGSNPPPSSRRPRTNPSRPFERVPIVPGW